MLLQHPVYCLKVVGAQNSHNVISISTDGKLCSWSLDMLAQPQEILDLQHKQNKAVAATCLAFPQGSVNNFVIGSEEGAVYSGIFSCPITDKYFSSLNLVQFSFVNSCYLEP